VRPFRQTEARDGKQTLSLAQLAGLLDRMLLKPNATANPPIGLILTNFIRKPSIRRMRRKTMARQNHPDKIENLGLRNPRTRL
jgi:hypothetical protein